VTAIVLPIGGIASAGLTQGFHRPGRGPAPQIEKLVIGALRSVQPALRF